MPSKVQLTGTNPRPRSSWYRRSASQLRSTPAAWSPVLQMAPTPHRYLPRSQWDWRWPHCRWSNRYRLVVQWILQRPPRTWWKERKREGRWLGRYVNQDGSEENDQVSCRVVCTYRAVPSIFTVAPTGSTNLVTRLSTPRLSSKHWRVENWLEGD